jgi:hypothetical protein
MATPLPKKETRTADGLTIKYHANGSTIWSKGAIVSGQPDGYWQWFRLDGTIKRSGWFAKGKPIGSWTTYDAGGAVYKVTQKKA